MEQNTRALAEELNKSILAGKGLEAFEKLCAEGVIMQENNDAPRIGKSTN
jgi:hypothetical protein